MQEHELTLKLFKRCGHRVKQRLFYLRKFAYKLYCNITIRLKRMSHSIAVWALSERGILYTHYPGIPDLN
jgi:hypothetical protein